MHSPDLVGAIFTYKQDAGTYRVRIDAVERDPQDTSGEVWLHHFSVQRPNRDWEPVCGPAADGTRWGFPIAGVRRRMAC
jgi:ADYC domain